MQKCCYVQFQVLKQIAMLNPILINCISKVEQGFDLYFGFFHPPLHSL